MKQLIVASLLVLMGVVACNQPPVNNATVPTVVEPPVSTVPVVAPDPVAIPDPVVPSMSNRVKPTATTEGSLKQK